jgi:hypothetical protein
MTSTYSPEIFRRAREILDSPLAYPGLVQRKRARVPLRVWRYPSFEPYCSWSVVESNEAQFIRRIVWDQSRTSLVEPATYGCEAPLEPQTFGLLMSELHALELSPFRPDARFGIDGTSYGIEAEAYSVSTRLVWWEAAPDGWASLQVWYERSVAIFESLLPASTANSR